MKKIFTLIAAALMTLGANAQTWDFTVLPTQAVDETGNMATNVANGVMVEDEGAAWATHYNQALEDDTELMAKAGEAYEPTKGLIWSAGTAAKSIYHRNYPVESNGNPYGGRYLFINTNPTEVMIPAKAGQTIEIVAGSAKNPKKITSAEIAEGEVVIEFGDVAYTYNTYTMTVKKANPYLSFENNIAIQKITVKDDATGIANVTANKAQNDNTMYNLAGQRITAPASGQIYILNGKKYIAK